MSIVRAIVGIVMGMSCVVRGETVALDGCRAILDRPQPVEGRSTTLVVYACPNGNTAEQTLGGRMSPGVDWHFDIQHVLAQLQVVRDRETRQNLTLAVIEADGKSWPTWRSKRGPAGDANIRATVEHLTKDVGAKDVVLMAHSGGGSFLFGAINAYDAIPSNVTRLVYLDANYGFDAEKHGPKLKAWLDANREATLVVVAYDDRRIEINGKRVLSAPDKGTYGATQRMIEWFDANGRPLKREKRDAFDVATDEAKQIRIAVRDNPENVIWHTRLVGDLNGVIYGLRAGIDADAWLSAPRAYEAKIAAPIVAEPTPTPMPTTTQSALAPTLTIAARKADAPGGHAVMNAVAAMSPADREARFRDEFLSGNVPAFLRQLRRVELRSDDHRGAVWVTPDVLAIGSDDDWVRVPMTPGLAQSIATAFRASLPTRKLVDDIARAADVRLEPVPLVPASEKGADALPERQRTDARESVRAFVQSHDLIESLRAGKPLGAIVVGAKKDIVLSNRLNEKAGRVAIYGWHRVNGTPIQPLTIVHGASYIDYSHGVRLVAQAMEIDGTPIDVAEVMKDPQRAALVSDEGPITGGYSQ